MRPDNTPPIVAAARHRHELTRVVMSSVRAAHLADEAIHLAYTTDAADLVIDVRRLDGRRGTPERRSTHRVKSG
jgi:hypothetical protein